MAKQMLDDEVWGIIQPLFSVKQRRFRHPGRKPGEPRRELFDW